MNGTGDEIKSIISSGNSGKKIDAHLYGCNSSSKAKAQADTSSLLSPTINNDRSSKSNISTFTSVGNFDRRMS